MNFNQICLRGLIAGFFYCAVSLAAAQTESSQKTDTLAVPAAISDALPSSTAPEVFYESDPKSWARVKRMVTPKYPAEALKNGVGAEVDIEVLIGISGSPKEIRSVKSTPDMAEFVEVTREVLQYWKFVVPQTNRCIPYETVGEAKLTFEVKNGEGVISLSHKPSYNLASIVQTLGLDPSVATPELIKQKAANLFAGIKMLNRDEYGTYAATHYPRSARRAGAQAAVHGLITVDPMTGHVVDAEIVRYIGVSDFKNEFSNAGLKALKIPKYPPKKNSTTPYKLCMTLLYRLKGESND